MTCGLQCFNLSEKLQKCIRMGITIFKIFNLGRYMVEYTVGNHVLRLRSCLAIKQNFRPYTSPNDNFEYSYPLILCSNPLIPSPTHYHCPPPASELYQHTVNIIKYYKWTLPTKLQSYSLQIGSSSSLHDQVTHL